MSAIANNGDNIYDEFENNYELELNEENENDISQKPNRCGEIILLHNNFYILCRYCENLLNSFDLFSNHIFEKHIHITQQKTNNREQFKKIKNNKCSRIISDEVECKLFKNEYFAMTKLEENEKQNQIQENYLKEPITITKNPNTKEGFVEQFYNYCENFIVKPEKVVVKVEPYQLELKIEENSTEMYEIDEETSLLDIIEKDDRVQSVDEEIDNPNDVIVEDDFKQIKKIVTPMTTKHNKTYKCPDCGRVYTRFESLKIHYRIHTGEQNPYKCNVCDKSFSAPCKLIVHKRVHTGERPFQCNLCPQAFKAKQKLNNHLESHEKGTIRTPKIFIDGISIQERQPARLPILVQNKFVLPADTRREDGLFYCPLCDRKYRRFESLKEHALSHVEPKQYECYHCNKRFNKIRTLKIHIKSHMPNTNTRWKESGGGPVTCQFCENTFHNRYYLNEHISCIHSGEKLHECLTCKKTFAFKNNYILHMRTHCGDKRYQCNFCDLKFVQSSTKKRHERVVHLNELPFKCTICQEEFQKWKHLKEHIKNNHFKQNDDQILLYDNDENLYNEEIYAENHEIVKVDNDNITEETIIIGDDNSNDTEVNINGFICSVCGAYFGENEQFTEHCIAHGVNLNEQFVIEYMDNEVIVDETNK